MATVYLKPDAAGGGDGTSEAEAWNPTEWNANIGVGDTTYLVPADGPYAPISLAVTNKGVTIRVAPGYSEAIYEGLTTFAPEWVQHSAGTHPNVWSATAPAGTVSGVTDGYFIDEESDGTEKGWLFARASIDQVRDNPGSWFVTGGVLYISLDDSEDPNTSGRTIGYTLSSANQFCLRQTLNDGGEYTLTIGAGVKLRAWHGAIIDPRATADSTVDVTLEDGCEIHGSVALRPIFSSSSTGLRDVTCYARIRGGSSTGLLIPGQATNPQLRTVRIGGRHDMIPRRMRNGQIAVAAPTSASLWLQALLASLTGFDIEYNGLTLKGHTQWPCIAFDNRENTDAPTGDDRWDYREYQIRVVESEFLDIHCMFMDYPMSFYRSKLLATKQIPTTVTGLTSSFDMGVTGVTLYASCWVVGIKSLMSRPSMLTVNANGASLGGNARWLNCEVVDLSADATATVDLGGGSGTAAGPVEAIQTTFRRVNAAGRFIAGDSLIDNDDVRFTNCRWSGYDADDFSSLTDSETLLEWLANIDTTDAQISDPQYTDEVSPGLDLTPLPAGNQANYRKGVTPPGGGGPRVGINGLAYDGHQGATQFGAGGGGAARNRSRSRARATDAMSYHMAS